ncbi:hypothetical protein ACH5RR_003470 [Cinchona calisaya]|uniref:Uncharacterized protein n=1 Tax=Cinchona calisaya TaxID=153742 RepID=A0ABD3AVI6_9GENT
MYLLLGGCSSPCLVLHDFTSRVCEVSFHSFDGCITGMHKRSKMLLGRFSLGFRGIVFSFAASFGYVLVFSLLAFLTESLHGNTGWSIEAVIKFCCCDSCLYHSHFSFASECFCNCGPVAPRVTVEIVVVYWYFAFCGSLLINCQMMLCTEPG